MRESIRLKTQYKYDEDDNAPHTKMFSHPDDTPKERQQTIGESGIAADVGDFAPRALFESEEGGRGTTRSISSAR
jgi:hypothetical protein